MATEKPTTTPETKLTPAQAEIEKTRMYLDFFRELMGLARSPELQRLFVARAEHFEAMTKHEDARTRTMEETAKLPEPEYVQKLAEIAAANKVSVRVREIAILSAPGMPPLSLGLGDMGLRR